MASGHRDEEPRPDRDRGRRPASRDGAAAARGALRPLGRNANRRFLVSLARAAAGAVIFSLPIFMTMEVWALGFTMGRARLALLLVLLLPLLVGLSRYVGFRPTRGWRQDLADALAAYTVAFAIAAAALWLFGVLRPGMPADELLGKVTLQAVSGSLGATLARSQLGYASAARQAGREAGLAGELFLVAAGALFLGLSIAPTEELALISSQTTRWRVVVLALASLLIMHAFVYAVRFRGEEAEEPPGSPGWSVFLRYTVTGYVVALAVSLYALWTFGQTDGLGLEAALTATVVLGLPAAVGAAAARLIL